MAFADLLLLNKIDLVAEESGLAHIEGRLRALNKWAPIRRCQNASVALDAVLNLRGFELDRVLQLDPEFLGADGGEHVHDARVTSVGFHVPGVRRHDGPNLRPLCHARWPVPHTAQRPCTI